MLLLAGAKIRPDQDMQRWMLRPILGKLLEIEERSVKEISKLTGWSVPLVKVRAFRARAEMRKIVARMTKDKYL